MTASSPTVLRTPRWQTIASPPSSVASAPRARRCVRRRARKAPFGHARRDDRRDEAGPAALVGGRVARRGLVGREAAREPGGRVGPDLAGDLAQLARHLDRGGRAIGRGRRQEAGHDRVEPGRRVAEHLREPRRVRRHEAREDRDGRRPDVRRPSGDHLEQRRAEGVEVGSRVDLAVAARLLGRHVRGRADDRPGARQLRVLGRGDAEVDELHVGTRRRLPRSCRRGSRSTA